VDVITAFISYRPELSPHLRLRLRGGIMIPPVSLENDGPAWTATRTITSSAANTWIGEEVRTTGLEATLAWKDDFDEVSVLGSGFTNNDGAGTLLAYRGWALQDRLTGYDDQLPLAAIPTTLQGGALPQAPWVQPMTEIDGKVGYYTGAGWRRNNVFDLNGFYYDNNGNGTTFDGFQYAWKTHFANVGALIHLPFKIELLGQHMWGEAIAGDYPAYSRAAIDAPFWTTYGLLSVPFGRSRLSLRYDDFGVDSKGYASDSTYERGHAWTGAYLLRVGEAHRFAVEVIHVTSDRADRAPITPTGFPPHADELQAQASFMFRF
jgi:hypothetical protein